MTETTAPVKREKIRIVCVSDTHGHANGEGFKLPAGDLLVHAGDLTNQGSLKEVQKAARWLEQADFEHKIVVAGNHDLSLDNRYCLKHTEGWGVQPEATEQHRQVIEQIPGVTYLEHESRTIKIKGRNLHVFASPYSVDNGKQNWAFQYDSVDATDTWSSIPRDTDLLITHTPPFGVLDASKHWHNGGCSALLKRVRAVRPLLHVFGHHHEGRGAGIVNWDDQDELGFTVTPWTDPGAGNRKQSLLDLTNTYEHGSEGRCTAVVNASIMRESWSRSAAKAFNKPIVVDIDATLLAYD